MSIVVKCDKCGKQIADDENRVILQATRYTVLDQESATQTQPVVASAPPGTMTPPAAGNSLPVAAVPGSSTLFTTVPAFDGQLEMHEKCWDEWINQKAAAQLKEETDEQE